MKFLIFAILVLSFSQLFSQTVKFNKNYYDSFPADLRNVVENDSGYVVVGGGVNNYVYVLIMQINKSGDISWIKHIGDSNFNTYHGYQNSLKKAFSGGYFLCGSRVNSTGNEALLFRFDAKFDTLWMKSYLKDSLYIGGHGCTQGADSSFYIIGIKEIADNNRKMIVIKADTNGSLIWSKQYGSGVNYFEDGYTITNTWDKGLLLGGWKAIYNNGYSGDWYIVRTDSNGLQKNQWTFGNPNMNDSRVIGLITTKDSGFVISGSYAYDETGPTTQLYNARAIKMNKNFQIVWDKQFIFGNKSRQFGSVIELENNDLAIIQSTADSMGYNFRASSGFMLLDQNGNRKWLRTYFPFNNDSSFATDGTLFAIAHTSDGGFILSGYAYSTAQTPHQQMWILKTDCKGFDKPAEANFSYVENNSFVQFQNLSQNVDSCIWDFGDNTPLLFTSIDSAITHTYSDTGNYIVKLIVYNGCSPLDNDTIIQAIHITNTNIDWNYVLEKSISIYPNPTKNLLNISSSKSISAIVYLLNMQGETLTQYSLQNKTEITLNNFSQGIYFVKIISDKGVVTKKFVKQ